MAVLTSLLARFHSATAMPHDDGQTMAEYGLILAGIAVIVMATVWLLGGAINTTFQSIVTQF